MSVGRKKLLSMSKGILPLFRAVVKFCGINGLFTNILCVNANAKLRNIEDISSSGLPSLSVITNSLPTWLNSTSEKSGSFCVQKWSLQVVIR